MFEKLGKTAGGDVISMRLDKVIEYYNDGRIIEYENNRGLVGVSKLRIKEIAENFDPTSWAMITLCKVDSKSYTLVDGNTRIAALMRAYNEGLMDEGMLRNTVLFQVCKKDDFMQRYDRLNNNKAHNARESITNPDTSLGQLIWDLCDDQYIRVKFASQIAMIAKICAENSQEIWQNITGETFKQVVASSSEVGRIARKQTLEDIIVVSEAKKKRIKNAINYVLEVREALEDEAAGHVPLVRTAVKRALNNAGLFLAFLTSAMSEDLAGSQPIFRGRDAEEVAIRFIEKLNKVQKVYPDLSRHSTGADEKYDELSKILFRRR